MVKKSTPPTIDATGCVNAAVAIFIGLIGVAQAAGGIGSLVWAVHAIFDEQDWIHAAVATAAAALFGSVGFGLLVAMWVARPRVRVAVGSDAPPGEPWLGRADWAAGRIPASGGATAWAPVLAAVALWWNFASLPLLSVLPTFLQQAPSKLAWLVLLVPVVGLLLIWAFFYQFFRAHKFGRSVFELASVPGLVGGQLAGVVRIPRRLHVPDGFRVRLVCVEWSDQGAHERHRVDDVVWQDERLVKDALVEGNETGVPVLFAIPFKLPETSRPDADRDFDWRLEAWAYLAGIDYWATFEVPVYKTAESRPDFQLDEKLLADYAPRPGNDLVLRDTGILREQVGVDGVRLTFKAARNWRMALVVSLLALAFASFGCGFLLYNDELQNALNLKRLWQNVANDPGVLAVVGALFQTVMVVVCGTIFVVITLYLCLASLDLWLYRSVVEASPVGLTFRGGWMGLGRQQHFAPENIRRFNLENYMRSSGGGLWKSVVLVPRSGHGERITIGKGIASKLAQEAVIDELNTALGRTK